MGGLFSSAGSCSQPSESEFSISRLAAKPPPPSNKKCSTEEYCKIEDLEINSLKKMKDMDEANTKQWNLTSETFDQMWDEFMQNNGNIMKILAIPTFTDEREAIAEAFSGGTSDDKDQVTKNYKGIVDETLDKIAKKNASEFDAAAEAAKNAPPPDPKKKK